jgi:hypothetical protein
LCSIQRDVGITRPGLVIGHIITRTGVSFEPALRSDGVENRFLHLTLGDPRRVAARRWATVVANSG